MAPIVEPPDCILPFELMCDVSNFGVGAVLGQRRDKKPFVIYYAGKMLDKAQMKYSTMKKEILVVVFAIKKFCQYLLGSKVIVYANHFAIKYLMEKKDANPRLI